MYDFSVEYSKAFVFQYGTYLNSVWNRKFKFLQILLIQKNVEMNIQMV